MSFQKRKRSDFADGAWTWDSPGYKYELFLSFRGPDTRRTFADYLYESLVKDGFTVFRDEEELRAGANIGPGIERAIDDSRIHLPIFSAGYASSAWCLQELARMVKCQRESAGRQIVPIFYDVSPSDVRLRTGSYQEALLKHEGRYDKETVREWRKALTEVADLKGWDAREARLGKLVKDLVRELSIKLKKRQKVLPDHLVGIDGRVRDVMQLLDCGSPDVRFLVVHGMGGIGKTTLAMAVYNEISSLFDGCSFLSDIRETSLNGGMVRLQKQLLSDILKWSTDVNDGNDGTNLIREKFRNKRVLIVLDDMDELEQLKKLKGNVDWLGPGSRVIITTRNVGLLAFLPKEKVAYEMTEMDPWHALQLFSKHAFGETLPQHDLETLSNEIVATTGRIPLALEASGSFLRGKIPEVWAETLERLMKVPDRRVQETLRISYEALSWEEKRIYLDIACFFNGEESTSAKYAWKGCGYSPESGLATLTDMSLLKIDHGNILRMHDLIRDFGRKIVQEENHLNPGSQSRLWATEECLRVLREPVDYRRKSNVESLRLQFSEVQMLTRQDFASSTNLKFLSLERVNFVGDFDGLLTELRWLSWRNCPEHFRATNFFPRNLNVLKLSGSEIEDNWPGWHQFMKSPGLRLLELAECSRLTRLPKLSALQKLEILSVQNCKMLAEIDRSIGKLKELQSLHLSECVELRRLPNSIGRLQSLQQLDLSECVALRRLPNSIGKLQSLQQLDLSECVELRELPNSIARLQSLQLLDLSGCLQLRKLPDSIGSLEWLHKLDLSRCLELRKLPDSIGRLESLHEMDLSYTKTTELPGSIGNLRKLKVMNIGHSDIRRIPGSIGMVKRLEELHAGNCMNLKGDIPSEIGSLPFLKILNLSHTGIRSVPTTIYQLPHLLELHLEGCHEITQIPKLPSSLIKLYVESRSLKTVPSLSNLINLVNLILSDSIEESLSIKWDANFIQTPNLTWVRRTSKLKTLKLVHKSIMAPPGKLASLPSLKQLVLSCFDLTQLVLPSTLSMLKLINFNSLVCRSDLKNLSSLELCKSWLIEIPLNRFGQLEKLLELTVVNCTPLRQLSCSSGLKKLRKLRLLNCLELVEFQGLVKLESLESIRIVGCSSLASLPDLLMLKKLRTMEFIFCRSLVSLPSLSQVAFEDCYLVVDRCDNLSNYNGPFAGFTKT